jgi:Bacterial dnaA protein helix-turn-helix
MSYPVIHAVAHRYFITPADIVGRSRYGLFVQARAVAALIMRDRYGMSFPQIGARLDGRDHSSIMYLIKKARALVEHDACLAQFVAEHMAAPKLLPLMEPFKPRLTFRIPGYITTPNGVLRYRADRAARALGEVA